MLRNYFKISFRSLWKSKLNSAINIAGLGLGIAVCVLIMLFLREEWSFDTFHSKADRIYRVWGKEDYGPDQQFFWTTTPYPMGPTLKENFEEIESEVRINPIAVQIRAGESNHTESVSVVGKDFFSVFDFKAIDGNLQSALHRRHGLGHKPHLHSTKWNHRSDRFDRAQCNRTPHLYPWKSPRYPC